jgi:hypothetical protein
MGTLSDRGDEHKPPSVQGPDPEERAGASLRRRVSGPAGNAPAPTGERGQLQPEQPGPRPGHRTGGAAKRDVKMERSRVPPPSVRPVPEPAVRRRRAVRLGMPARIGAGIVVAMVAAVLVVGWLTNWNIATLTGLANRLPGSTEPARPVPRLVIAKAAPGAVDDLIPLGISLIDADNVDAVILSGLPSGSNINSGRPLADNEWHLYAYELADAAIRPAEGFVGSTDITVELQRARRTVDRQPLHLQWTSAAR